MRSGGDIASHGLPHAGEVGDHLGLVGDLGGALGGDGSLIGLRRASHGQVVREDREIGDGESFTCDESGIAALLSQSVLHLLVELLEVFNGRSNVLLRT